MDQNKTEIFNKIISKIDISRGEFLDLFFHEIKSSTHIERWKLAKREFRLNHLIGSQNFEIKSYFPIIRSLKLIEFDDKGALFIKNDEDKISISITSTVFKSPGIYITETDTTVFRHVGQKIVCV